MLVQLTVALAVGAPVAAGQESGAAAREPTSFHRDVRPILQASCLGCHQPARAKGRLVLTTYDDLMKGGEDGASVVPGKPDESLLIELVTTPDDIPPEMPEEGDPLTPEAVDTIRRWIAEGAIDDTPESLAHPFTMERPPVYARPPVVSALDFSPDGRLLALSGFHEVLLHRADGSGLVGRLVGLSERIESVAFSPDGSRLAVAGGLPARMGELQVWDVRERELRLSLPVTFDTIYGASWSPDGTVIAFGCADNTLRAIDVETGAEVLYQGAHADWVLDTAFSTDGSHLVSVGRDRTLKLTKVATQQFIDNITSITPGALKGGLIAVDRHPTRDELLVGGADGAPKVYRMYREKKRVIGDDYNLIRAYAALPGRVFAVEWSPDGEHFIAGSSHAGTGEVRVYRASEEAPVWTFESPRPVYAVAFHLGGATVAAAGADGVVRLFAADDGRLLREFAAAPLEGSTRTGSDGRDAVADANTNEHEDS